jgi:hypothetical protein
MIDGRTSCVMHLREPTRRADLHRSRAATDPHLPGAVRSWARSERRVHAGKRIQTPAVCAMLNGVTGTGCLARCSRSANFATSPSPARACPEGRASRPRQPP